MHRAPDRLQPAAQRVLAGPIGWPAMRAPVHRGRPTVIGVIGGYEQGGDSPSGSYAARFSRRFAILSRQACQAS